MPVKAKISPEEKIKFVEKYLTEIIIQREIGRITGGSHLIDSEVDIHCPLDG